MLHSLNLLYGKTLGSSDGEIGHVHDFYFDDQRWAVRYVVAETGSWLSERLVLVSPHAFGTLYEDGDSLLVNLSRRQIENSPSVELRKPVSRQYEEEYYRYYGWPSYWEGNEMWGASSLPIVPPLQASRNEKPNLHGYSRDGNDPHLRSTKAIKGYHIQTHDGAIGHVTDFMIDDKSWGIRHLVIETGHWYSGKEIVISPRHIERISYEDSKVFVNVTKEAIQNAEEYQRPSLTYHDTHNFDA
jgi:uncharacterized protein YrrD